jgi:hypothetical protein
LIKDWLYFSAGYKLMKIVGVDDLTKRLSPRLDKFHSIDPTGKQAGVTYWRKTYLYSGLLILLVVSSFIWFLDHLKFLTE